MIRDIPFINRIFTNQSHWEVVLKSGKVISELGSKTEYLFDRNTLRMVARVRKIQWYDDIVASGDTKHIKELRLVTPQGVASLNIFEDYTAFQLHRSTAMPFTGERLLNMQLIGRVDNRETGDCIAAIWDADQQRLYPEHKTTVRNFASWREGAAGAGALHFDRVGVRLL